MTGLPQLKDVPKVRDWIATWIETAHKKQYIDHLDDLLQCDDATHYGDTKKLEAMGWHAMTLTPDERRAIQDAIQQIGPDKFRTECPF